MDTLFIRVNNALEQIRPYLEADGGDIQLIEITDENVAKIRFKGACLSCNMSQMTLKAGVEETVKKAVPEILSVEAVEN